MQPKARPWASGIGFTAPHLLCLAVGQSGFLQATFLILGSRQFRKRWVRQKELESGSMNISKPQSTYALRGHSEPNPILRQSL